MVPPVGADDYFTDDQPIAPVRAVKVPQIWAEVEIAERWKAVYRLVLQNRRLVVGEIRLIPKEDDPANPQCDQGDWSATFVGPFAPVPPGGLTTRLFRKVPAITALVNQTQRALMEEMLNKAASISRSRRISPSASISPSVSVSPSSSSSLVTPSASASISPSAYIRLAKTLLPAESEQGASKQLDSTRRRGRKGRPHTFYANIARSYATLIDTDNPRPLQVIAARRTLTVEQVRAAVAKARRLGFLTPTTEGQKGGSLTVEGLRVLESSHRPRSKKSKTPARKMAATNRRRRKNAR